MEDSSIYKTRASKLGKFVEEMIDLLLIQGNGFIDTRKIWGILSLDKTYSSEEINNACKIAIEIKNYSYQLVKRILAAAKTNNNHEIKIKQTKEYRFVRSMDVYQKELEFIH